MNGVGPEGQTDRPTEKRKEHKGMTSCASATQAFLLVPRMHVPVVLFCETNARLMQTNAMREPLCLNFLYEASLTAERFTRI